MEKVYKDPETLLKALAEFIVATASGSIAANGRFSFVLSGGSSPKKLYEMLASGPYRTQIDWSKVFFFFGDERNVPHDHADSNYRMAKQALFAPLSIPDTRIFAIDTALAPLEAARSYEESIRHFFAGEPCRFDLILLGLGDNSHTASLFPHTPVLMEKKALVCGVYVDEVKMYRITFTAPLINLSHHVAFLVYGSGKADAVHHILREPESVDQYPAQLVRPDTGDVIWFLDEGAAARIK